MNYEVEKLGKVAVLRVLEADASAATGAGEFGWTIGQIVHQQDGNPIYIDLSCVSTIDGFMIEAIMFGYRAATQSSCSFAIAGITPTVLRELNAAGLMSKFPIHPMSVNHATATVLHPAAFEAPQTVKPVHPIQLPLPPQS